MLRSLSRYTHCLHGSAALIAMGFPIWFLLGHVACDIALSLIAVLFLIRSAIDNDWRWVQQPWVKCLLFLWVYIIARGLLAEDPLQALRRGVPFARYFIFAAALAYWVLNDAKTRNRFLLILTGIALFLAVDGLLQWKMGKDIIGHAVEFNTLGNMRLTGPFRHEILGIMLTWIYFPVCLSLLMTDNGTLRPRRPLLAGMGAALLLLAVILISGERMALLLVLFGWVIAIALLPVRKAFLGIILVAGLLLLGLLAMRYPDIFDRQVQSTINTFAHWQQSPYGLLLASDLQIAAQHPIFGVGINHFSSACQALYAGTPAAEACNTHPHNVYMEWLIEDGVIGLFMYLVFLFYVARITCKNWVQYRLDPLFIGLIIALSLRVWPLASSTNFFSPWGAPPFWLVLGTLLAYSAGREKNDAGTPIAV